MRQMAIMRKMMEDNAKVFLLIILGRKAQSWLEKLDLWV
jgi:hypothetical protein